MVSYMAHGLFARAISQSGCLYGLPQETRSERAEKTKSIAKFIDCPFRNDTLSCLRSTSAEELLTTFPEGYLTVNPITIDGEFGRFMPQSLTDQYKHHQTQNGVEYMMGVTSEEGYISFLMAGKPEDMVEHVLHGVALQNAYPFLRLIAALTEHPPQASKLLEEFIKNKYMPDFDDKLANLRGVLDAFADMLFVAPTVGTAKRVAEEFTQSVYLYYFDQPTDFLPGRSPPFQFPMYDLKAKSEMSYGAFHGFDGFYMFAIGVLKDVPLSIVDLLSPADRALSRSMVHAWTTFAKTG